MGRIPRSRKALIILLVLLGSLPLLKLSGLFSQTPPVTTVSVGNEPRGLAVNPTTNKAVVTSHNSNTVTVANLANNTTVSVPVGQHPYGVAINTSTNKAYITNEKSDSVSVLNLSNNTISATITVGGNPREIGVNSGTSTAVVANSKSDTVSILNLSNNTVSKTLSVGIDPEGVVINTINNRAFVTNSGANTVSVIDLATKAVTATLTVGSGPAGIGINASTQRIVVANRLSDSVSILNGSTNALVATVPVGSGPQGVAINPSTNRVYVSNTLSDSVSVIDLSNNIVIATYPVGRNPVGIAVVSNLLLVANDKADTVWVIDLTNPPTGTVIPVGRDPEGVALDRGGNTAVTANSKSNDLSVVDLSNGTSVATLPAGKSPQDVAIHPTSKRLISANYKANTASIYDLPSRTLLATVSVGKGPRAVAIDPILNIAAVTNERDGTLTLIDLSNNAVTATLPAGSHPTDLDINPTTHLAVVANKKSDTVTILDLVNRVTVATVSVGKDPISVAINSSTNIAAVANEKSNTVSLINLTTRAVTATINVLATPTGVAINPVTNIAAIVSHEMKNVQTIDLSTNTVLTPNLAAGWEPKQLLINPDTNVAVVTNEDPGAVAIVQLSNPVPTLSSLSPTSISGGAGFTLTLNGAKFLKTSTVKFGTQSYSSHFISSSQLQADIPASAVIQPGAVAVSVTNPAPGGGTSGSLNFTITTANNPIPSISSIVPTSVNAGAAGFTLTIDGTNFVTASSVSFNGMPLTAAYVSSVRLTATVPSAAIATAGTFSVFVTNPAPGGGVSNAATLTVNNPAPTLTSISPTTVLPGSGATALTVNGTNFVGNAFIQFNGAVLQTTYVNTNQLTATISATLLASAGAFPVTVVNPSPGGATSNPINLIVNTAPVANAGNSRNTTIGKAVTLDGRQSTDADGDKITFSWSLSSVPPGSAAVLARSTSIQPSFTPDVAGSYQLQLRVNDGKVNSLPSVVTVTAYGTNAPPNADAGLDQTAVVGQSITLDGRRSSDPEDNRLSYHWSIFSSPPGSGTALSNASSVIPSLTPDIDGTYILQLIVNDGSADSPPAQVKVTVASANVAPTARAGKDRNVLTGNSVALSGSASRDPNGGPLTYRWVLISTPPGSVAAMTAATTVTPLFTPDISGEYLIRLVVNDGTSDSAPDTILVVAAAPNPGPNAVAGSDQSAKQSDTVMLDGTGSSDPNGNPITYAWTIVSTPAGSHAVLSNTVPHQPTYVADLAGNYVVRLVVNDGTSDSFADTVVVTVLPISSLAISPVNPSINQGQAQQFAASANFSDNTIKDVTASVTWSSSDSTVATINAAGLATSLKGGTTQIGAAYGPVISQAQTLTVISLPPTIGSFAPTSGVVGTSVTITGTNFDSGKASNNKITFNGTPAIVSAVTATTITTTVPLGATSGPISVTTLGGSATSATSFTVLAREDFSLTAAPGLTSVVQGKGTTYQVNLSSNGQSTLTNLIGLSASGLPSGATATFSPASASIAQGATLTLQTTSSTPAGTFNVTVTGSASLEGRNVSRTATIQLTVIGSGGTTLAGRILASKDDTPIRGAILKLGTQSTNTDESGNFFFSNPPIGDQLILIDGPTEVYPAALPVPVTIASGVANTLPYPIYLHENSQQYTTIVPGQQATVNPPNVPDFFILIPQGTQIIGWDGQPNTKISVTPVPIDRLPVRPIPNGVQAQTVYMFSFGKPGGGFPTRPIPIIYPNDLGAQPGERINLWYYDESPDVDPTSHQWKIYGQGTVSQNGKTIVPDPGVGQPRFCCGASFPARQDQVDPDTGDADDSEDDSNGDNNGNNTQDPGDRGGEPVDLSSGIFILHKTDFVLPGISPLKIQRTYRTLSTGVGIFGVGGSFNFDLLVRVSGSQALTLLRPNGSRFIFSQGSDGKFTNSNYPGYRGTVFSHFPDGHFEMRSKNGTTFVFNNDGWVIEKRDRNNRKVLINRNSQNVITDIVDPFGRALTFAYTTVTRGISSFFLIKSITDPLGRIVQYGYDGLGRLTTVTDPAGGVTTYAYDSLDRMISITDPRGITYLTNEYDDAGRVIRQTQADGSIYSFRYILAGTSITQTELTDPNGNTTIYRFNGSQRVSRIVNAQGQLTRFERDYSTNLLMTIYDPLNRRRSFTYDLNGNITSIVDPAGNTTLMEYEPFFSRLTNFTNSIGSITHFDYDLKGNLMIAADALGSQTRFTYDSFGQLATTTDVLGNTRQFEHDSFGNLISTTDPLGNKTFRAYDLISRITSVTNSAGKATDYVYDTLNRVTQIQDALSGLTLFSYDPNGNLITATDTKGHITALSYDVMDRVVTRTDAFNRTESYTYDLNGNLKTFSDRKGQLMSFTYDSLNQRVNSSFADGSSIISAYNTIGKLSSITDSNSGRIDFGYDSLLDQLIKETTDQGAIEYSYDALGQRITMTANGQQPVHYLYDANSKLTQIEKGTQVVGLGYDAKGRRTSLTYPNGTNTTYRYSASRLIEILHQGPSIVIEDLLYTYDAVGNRISYTRTNNTAILLPNAMQAAYDVADEQIEFNGAPSMTFDANGNLTSQNDATGLTTYTWNARNELVGINGPNVSANFTYDSLGRRISKTINGVKTIYQYDNRDIVTEISGGAIEGSYLRSLNIDEVFIRESSGSEYYHADALGSVLNLTDAAGLVTASYRYEAFGKVAMTGSTTNPFQYTGRENDGTGLYYYRARYYSPSLQRFISEDPQASINGVSLYVYALNNPLTWIDPTGLTTWPTNYGTVTDPFGSTQGRTTPHNGVDIRNPRGGNVRASDSGTVDSVFSDPRGGNQIIIKNDDGSVSGYAHTGATVEPGQHVEEGQIIGHSDGSGGVVPHLHYTYRPCDGCDRQDPLDHLPPRIPSAPSQPPGDGSGGRY